ncbi:MAG: glycosyltransferase 87 family protein [Marinilabiliaceae bacterium]
MGVVEVDSVNHKRLLPWIIVAAGVTLRVLMATSLRIPVNGDIENFLLPWVDYIRTHGAAGLADEFNNYAPAYIYLLAFISWAGLPEVAAIRLLSALFDYVCAYFVGRILRRMGVRIGKGIDPMPWALAVVPLMPTMLINSCYWGQCDSIYSACALAAVSFAMEGRSWRSAVALGLAFAFKLQAVFVVPLFFALWLRGRMGVRHFAIVPLIYVLVALPEILIGRDPALVMTVYLHQAGTYEQLNMGFCGIFSIAEAAGLTEGDALKVAGCAVVAVAGVCYGLWLRQREWGESLFPLVGLVGAVAAAWLLPGMHERYLFVGDLLGLVCAVSLTGRARLAALSVPAASLYCYLSRSRFESLMPLWPAAIVLFVAAVVLFVSLLRRTGKTKSEPAEMDITVN